MNIPLMPGWSIVNPFPANYDVESKTVIEQTARMYGKVNELIESYNTFTTNIENKTNEFIETTNGDYEAFKISIRQEFQDFIDVIEIKLDEQQKIIDNAVSYMSDNIISTTKNVINDSITRGDIVINTVYDENTENLNIVADGSV